MCSLPLCSAASRAELKHSVFRSFSCSYSLLVFQAEQDSCSDKKYYYGLLVVCEMWHLISWQRTPAYISRMQILRQYIAL